MKKSLLALPFLFLGLASCGGGSSETVITVAASELPHAKILKEAVAPVLKQKGFDIQVKVLDWTQQNSAVARGEYDANYFQHMPYLETYNAEAGDASLEMVCKVHFEQLCLYASNTSHMTVENGDTIEIVNDVSNIERALLLLKDNGILSAISDDCYVDGTFTKFNEKSPNTQVTFADAYSNCSLTCIQESNLPTSLADYDFGVIPGNTALTGLGSDYASRIVFGEKIDDATLSLRANGIAVKPSNAKTEKTKALVSALADSSISEYISKTFGQSVIYHYEDLTK